METRSAPAPTRSELKIKDFFFHSPNHGKFLKAYSQHHTETHTYESWETQGSLNLPSFHFWRIHQKGGMHPGPCSKTVAEQEREPQFTHYSGECTHTVSFFLHYITTPPSSKWCRIPLLLRNDQEVGLGWIGRCRDQNNSMTNWVEGHWAEDNSRVPNEIKKGIAWFLMASM